MKEQSNALTNGVRLSCYFCEFSQKAMKEINGLNLHQKRYEVFRLHLSRGVCAHLRTVV